MFELTLWFAFLTCNRVIPGMGVPEGGISPCRSSYGGILYKNVQTEGHLEVYWLLVEKPGGDSDKNSTARRPTWQLNVRSVELNCSPASNSARDVAPLRQPSPRLRPLSSQPSLRPVPA